VESSIDTGDTPLDRAGDVGPDLFRFVRETALEIGVDRQIDRAAQRFEVPADLVERDAVVGLADRPSKAGAGGGDRLEAHVLQRPRAADVPGVGQHEAAGLVHPAECGALVRCGDRHDLSPSIVFLGP
jgi:hypothetical protein